MELSNCEVHCTLSKMKKNVWSVKHTLYGTNNACGDKCICIKTIASYMLRFVNVEICPFASRKKTYHIDNQPKAV